MIRQRRYPGWLSGLLLLGVLISCESGGGATPTEPDTVTLEPANPEVATYEFVRVTVRGVGLGSASYAGTLGPTAITAQRSSDSTVVFQVPELAPGEHTLRLTIGRASGEATLSVESTAGLDDPAAFVASVDSTLTLEIDEIEAWYGAQDESIARFLPADAFAADVAMMRATLAELQSDFAGLSAAEQRTVAMTIRAYRSREAAIAASGMIALQGEEEEYFPQCQWPEVATAEEMRACRRQYRTATINTARTVEQCDIDFNASWAEGDYDGAIGKNYIAFACMKARMLRLKREVAESVRAGVRGLFGLDNGSSWQTRAAFSQNSAPAFIVGSPRVYEPPLLFQNFSADDIGTVPAATELGELLEEMSYGWDAINAMYPRQFQQSPPWLHELHELNSMALGYDRTALSIGQIEPATIEIRDTVIDNRWVLEFITAHDTQIQTVPVTFEVIYDGGEFGSDTTLVSSAVHTHPLMGEWEIQMDLEVTGWHYVHENRVDYSGTCTGTETWTGQRVNWEPAPQDTFSFSSIPLRCQNALSQPTRVYMLEFYTPAAPDYVAQPGTDWAATISFDGESLSLVGHIDGESDRYEATMEGRFSGDRWEGTYTFVNDNSAAVYWNGAYFQQGSGTFVAVRKPPEVTP